MTIKLICLDADDTLWHNERHFRNAQQQLAKILGASADWSRALEDVEHRNLPLYGFGVKGFTLSMLETAARVLGSDLNGQVVEEIVNLGKALLTHPVELLEGVVEALDDLETRAPLILITKGDLHHQESKLAASGLGERFLAVEIVSDKQAKTFAAAFSRRGIEPSEAVVIGDSMRSDILPALEAGAYAAHVPHPLAWSYEGAEEPADNPRFRRVSQIAQVPQWIDTLR